MLRRELEIFKNKLKNMETYAEELRLSGLLTNGSDELNLVIPENVKKTNCKICSKEIILLEVGVFRSKQHEFYCKQCVI